MAEKGEPTAPVGGAFNALRKGGGCRLHAGGTLESPRRLQPMAPGRPPGGTKGTKGARAEAGPAASCPNLGRQTTTLTSLGGRMTTFLGSAPCRCSLTLAEPRANLVASSSPISADT